MSSQNRPSYAKTPAHRPFGQMSAQSRGTNSQGNTALFKNTGASKRQTAGIAQENRGLFETDKIRKTAGTVLEKGKDGTKNRIQKGAKTTEGAGELLGTVLKTGKDGVKSLVGKGGQALKGAKELLGSIAGKGKEGLKSLEGKGAKTAEGVKELMGTVLKKAVETSRGSTKDFKETGRETWQNIKGSAKGIWKDITDTYEEYWGEGSKKKQAGEKERTGFDKAWDFAGKIWGSGVILKGSVKTEIVKTYIKILLHLQYNGCYYMELIKKILVESGWEEGRKVDLEDIKAFNTSSKYKWNELQENFVEEYAFLEIKYMHPKWKQEIIMSLNPI